MGWVSDFFKGIAIEAMREALEPNIRTIVREELDAHEPRIRAIVGEELDAHEHRIRTIVREELDAHEPHIRTIVREEMRVAFDQEWLPRIQTMVRGEMHQAFREEWVPQLQAMWREDIRQLRERTDARFDALQVRLDTLTDIMLRRVDIQATELATLSKEVYGLREDLERVKAHIGMAGGNAQ